MAKYYVFCHIDGDANRDLVNQFNVTAYPTMVFLTKDGKEVHRMVGAAPVNVVVAEMEKARQMAGG